MLAVLVIEKDALTRDTIVQMVEALDNVAIGVDLPEAGLAYLERVGFDVIIVSLRESDPDGADTALKAKAIYPKVKLVVASGHALLDELSNQVDGFLRKPFDLDELDSVMKGVTQSKLH